MRSTSGASLGRLTLNPAGAGVRIAGTLTGVPSGPHGIHFHQVGLCERPDFESASAHVNPTNALHGLENPLGPHAGDLPNISANAAGQVVIDLTSMRVSFDAGLPGWLFDADGTALVIHQNADDQRSDPTGNSGARIACGVIERG
jgi:Cu-Zn family superoxide dismutase